MKKANGIVSKRRENILEHLKLNEEISTNELAEKLQISPLTLRRDLQALEKEGLVNKFYGGAKLASSTGFENINEGLEEDNQILKRKAIAKYAASLIHDGDAIFINSSFTALLILQYLGDKRVYVVTNNGKALQTSIGPNIKLVLTGGEVYERKQSLVGEFAIQTLSKITANKCFIGVSGIDSDSGISTSVLEETLVNHEMINRCSGPIYILADSSKIGRHHNFSSGDINEITHLITDSDIDEEEVKKFVAKKITVIPLGL
jgi:DeoR family fructose operon transcriptional repressor